MRADADLVRDVDGLLCVVGVARALIHLHAGTWLHTGGRFSQSSMLYMTLAPVLLLLLGYSRPCKPFPKRDVSRDSVFEHFSRGTGEARSNKLHDLEQETVLHRVLKTTNGWIRHGKPGAGSWHATVEDESTSGESVNPAQRVTSILRSNGSSTFMFRRILRPRRPFGSMPYTAFSMMRSGMRFCSSLKGSIVYEPGLPFTCLMYVF